MVRLPGGGDEKIDNQDTMIRRFTVLNASRDGLNRFRNPALIDSREGAWPRGSMRGKRARIADTGSPATYLLEAV